MNETKTKELNPDRQVEEIGKKRKCLCHPALRCPTPEEPCIFTNNESSKTLSQRRVKKA